MKTRLLVPVLLAALLGACGTPGQMRPDLLGTPVAPSALYTREIVITPDTYYVHVTGGEVIRFIVGNKSFGWSFDGPTSLRSFDLRQVAPPGLLQHIVTADVYPNPLYIRDR